MSFGPFSCYWVEISYYFADYKGLLPEDPETSHSPHHVPSATQMGHVRIWEISQGMSQSGRQRDIN